MKYKKGDWVFCKICNKPVTISSVSRGKIYHYAAMGDFAKSSRELTPEEIEELKKAGEL